MAAINPVLPANPPRRPYPEQWLLGYSRQHVLYEFDMLFWATWIPGRIPLAGDPGHVQRTQNALVEAFPVHLRNVIEFLYCGTPHGTPTPIVRIPHIGVSHVRRT